MTCTPQWNTSKASCIKSAYTDRIPIRKDARDELRAHAKISWLLLDTVGLNRPSEITRLFIEGPLVKTKLAKSFSDAALGAFFQMLNYKTAYRFGQVVKVGRFYPSSKTCQDCKSIQHLELSDRDWMCIGCGVIHDRDHNAAKNILSEGLRILAAGMAESQNADGGDVRLATASSSR